MLNITQGELEARLVKEFDYLPYQAESVIKDLAKLEPVILAEFEGWWLTGDCPTVEVEGFTVMYFMQEHGMNVIAALLTLSWLLVEPEKAKKVIARGYDRVCIRNSQSK